MMAGEAARLVVSVTADTGVARKALTALSDTVHSTANAIAGASKPVTGFAAKVNSVIDGMKGKFTNFFGRIAEGRNSVVNFFGQIGDAADGLRSTMGAVVGLARATIGGAAKMETYATQFRVFLGSADAAKDRMRDLAKFAAETPFELPQIVEASRILQAYTGNVLAAGEGLRMVGDIAAGTGREYSQIATLMGRLYDALQSGGNVGEPLLYLAEAGAISGDARRNITALSEAVKEGGMSADAAWSKVTEEFGKFRGMTKELAGTFAGKWSTLMDTINMGLAGIGEEFLPIAKSLVDFLIPAIEGAAASAKTFVRFLIGVGTALKPLAPVIGTLLPLALAAATGGMVGFVKSMAVGAFLGPIGAIGNLIATMLGLKQVLALTTAQEGLSRIGLLKFQVQWAALLLQEKAVHTFRVAKAIPSIIAHRVALLAQRTQTIAVATATKAQMIPAMTRMVAVQTAAGVATAKTGAIMAGSFVKQGVMAAAGAIPKLIGFVKTLRLSMLMGLIPALAATVVAFGAQAAAAVAAGIASLAALGPFLPIIAAIALAVGALWLAWETNFLGIRDVVSAVFGVIGPILETIANVIKTIIDVIVGVGQAILEFLGLAEASDIAGESITGVGEAAEFTTSALTNSFIAKAPSFEEGVKGFVAPLASSFADAGAKAREAVHTTITGILAEIVESRGKIEEAASGAADATWGPQIVAAQFAITQRELDNARAEALDKSKTAAERAEAALRVLNLEKEQFQRSVLLATYGDEQARIAKLKGLLQSKEMLAGLKAGGEVGQWWANLGLTIEAELGRLEGKVDDYGERTGRSYVSGVANAIRVNMYRVKTAMAGLDAILRASSPPGPKSPLHFIDKWGFRTGLTWARRLVAGIETARLAVNKTLTGVAGTIMSPTSPVASPATVNGAIPPASTPVEVHTNLYLDSALVAQVVERYLGYSTPRSAYLPD